PFVYLMIQCASVAACGIGLFFIESYFWLFAAAYWVVWMLGVLDRFILMLHCTSHRILFRREYRSFNRVIPWLLSPFFGETPETYFTHHMGMHHPENNMHADLSTTLPYQRDRISHWLHYFLTFFTRTAIDLTRYHFQKGNPKMARRTMFGELSFWFLVLGLMFVNWRATVVVFVVPLVLVRILMMAGNWAQHAFINPSDPENPYVNSITCINTRYNRRCFNDGYHIHHHVNARCHWTEYPAEFETNREIYGKHDAIVFDGVDFFEVWLMLMLKRYRALARRFVQLPGAPTRTEDEVIAFLKSRLVPVV
ncbi:MAG: fatty acid desaturase, partial [Myxococcota bacterium]